MKDLLKSNKNGVIAILVLILVCGGSFIGVRSLNSGSKPAVNTTASTTVATTESTTTATTTMATTTTQATTESTTAATTESTTATSSVITTFAVPTTAATTESTTVPPAITTEPPVTLTTSPVTTKATTTKAPSAGDQGNGAIFDDGVASYKYDPEGNYYYTNSDPWQRSLGYNEAYDIGAGFVGIFMDTMRCRFRYDNRDWMIQFWKGQYGYAFVGHEIGVYTKPLDRDMNHYDAASNEDALYMAMTGYKNGEELYTRDYGKYWWCTGFVPGSLKRYSDRSELSLKARITMKDYTMLIGFTKSLEENGLVKDKDYSVKGRDVYVTW